MAVAAGCFDSSYDIDADSGVGLGDGGTTVQQPEWVLQFYSELEPILVGDYGETSFGACGGCHARESTPPAPRFLDAKPDLLENMLAYPAIVGATPAASRLYAKGAHAGPAFTAEQATKVAAWIDLYNLSQGNKADAKQNRVAITPLQLELSDPARVYALQLRELNATLDGQLVTFRARLIGDANSTTLNLYDIKVSATSMAGVRLSHPLWVKVPMMGDPEPEPNDAFQGLDQKVYPNEQVSLGAGTFFWPNFTDHTAKVTLTFNIAETQTGSADGGTGPGGMGGGCKNVASFMTNAVPALVNNNYNGAGAMAGCIACHTTGSGRTSLNMQNIGPATTDPALQASACSALLGVVRPVTPATSYIFAKTDPAGTGHAGRFIAGTTNTAAADFAAFSTALTTWITAEQ